MFDYTAALSSTVTLATSALGAVDPTTSVGGLLLVSLVLIAMTFFLKRIKRIVPR